MISFSSLDGKKPPRELIVIAKFKLLKRRTPENTNNVKINADKNK